MVTRRRGPPRISSKNGWVVFFGRDGSREATKGRGCFLELTISIPFCFLSLNDHPATPYQNPLLVFSRECPRPLNRPRRLPLQPSPCSHLPQRQAQPRAQRPSSLPSPLVLPPLNASNPRVYRGRSPIWISRPSRSRMQIKIKR